MDQIYYLGSNEMKEKITKALQLLGYDLKIKEDFQLSGRQIVIYCLKEDLKNSLNYLKDIPDNLIIISPGKEEYMSYEPNIFIYSNLNFLHFQRSFSSYFNQYLKARKTKKSHLLKGDQIPEAAEDFYLAKEKIRIYYLTQHPALADLQKVITKSRNPVYLARLEAKELIQITYPGKYYLFIRGDFTEIGWLKNNKDKLENLILVAYRLPGRIKKELKSLGFSIPMIFINKVDKKTAKLLYRNFYS